MIEVETLTKQFGTKLAVDNLTFTVKKGEVLGFLGPNGAGKSTTMRMITGFIPPTHGDARVCGISIVDNPGEAKTKIGYLPESAPLYNDMTVVGFLKFCAAIRGLKGTAKSDAVERAIEDNVPAEYQQHAHHWLILHGRYICTARTPKCGICPIRDWCQYEEKLP